MKKQPTPEERLMKAIGFKPKRRTADEALTQFENSVFTLHINAINRRDELMEMVNLISANKYFPNEHYRNVFRWSLMEAAQWQYERMKEALRTEYEKGRYDMREEMMAGAIDATARYIFGEGIQFDPDILPFDLNRGDKVKLIIVKEN